MGSTWSDLWCVSATCNLLKLWGRLSTEFRSHADHALTTTSSMMPWSAWLRNSVLRLHCIYIIYLMSFCIFISFNYWLLILLGGLVLCAWLGACVCELFSLREFVDPLCIILICLRFYE